MSKAVNILMAIVLSIALVSLLISSPLVAAAVVMLIGIGVYEHYSKFDSK